ncbi:peptidase [Methylobacillus sp. MM3]|jgi:predicted Zn-dependent protease|uniref:M48 family metalloprotease n=1 Tax=Methylobacillus sp. MM3 TaxID=1848039 RepID=UPI0007E07337|nr:M48 family metalloprotease [Methylobacillus sp. MM3]OAJ71225.1 peptidase [Methylobacillus sp. MM3]
MIKHSLLLAVFLASAPAQALDLGGVLKDALDKKQEEISAPAQADNPSQAENPSPDKSEPTINLKKPSRAEEIQVGREIAGNILGAAPLVKDLALQKYVNQVGRWVASQSERPYLPWHFGVIESEDLNAFAAPGGYVLITKGLYRQLKNESELAGVLGHEIGHVIKKHQLKLLQKQQLLSMGAGLLSGKLGKENPTVQKVVGSGAEISARSLDKSAEYEADRIGVVLAGRAGYEPFGLPEVLQAIGHAGKDDGRVALLFKTHPHPDDRLTALGDAIGSRLDKVEGKTLENRFYKLKN